MPFRKNAVLAVAAAGAVGTPWLVSDDGLVGMFSADGDKESAAAWPDGGAIRNAAPADGQNPPRVGYPVKHLSELFHFDLSPDWVTRRWPRVYTLATQSGLNGFRVPVVTGGAEHDLAGSLTYFFDQDRTLQRIEFHGTTGDPRTFVQSLVTRYGLRRQASTSARRYVYQVLWSGEVVSELRVETAPVLNIDAPHRRYRVNLLLERPHERNWFGPSKSQPSGIRL